MSNTRVVSTRELVRQEAIQFIRPQTLTLTLIEARPNTKMYVFFGEEDVTPYCYPLGGNKGDDLISDNVGQIAIYFDIELDKFNVGTYDIVVTDTSSLDQLEVVGSTFGSAKAQFSANGRTEFFQTTVTTIVLVERPQPVKVDPLAQSFFTYGVEGGLFVSSIDVFFNSKDQTLPVRMEVRPMINGYPAKLDVNNKNFISVLKPEQVNVSDDASVPTKFEFNPPIYLEADSDFCFVLRTNSNNYQVYTSRLGESSIEDGRKIYEQPYIGSVFKSENNITWTADQFEDIKFAINKAVFTDGTNAVLKFRAKVPELAAYGDQFKTVAGSNLITYRHAQDHGLYVDSKFNVITRTDATYNGIPSVEFNGLHSVVEVVDTKTIKFRTVTVANKTGSLESGGKLDYVTVISSGSNYSQTDTVNISGGGGAGATASLKVANGKIIGVEITNPGSGFVSSPAISVTSATGTGANLVASVLPTFTVAVNKPMTGFVPNVAIETFGDSEVTSSLRTTVGNYEGGNLTPYTTGQTIDFNTEYGIANLYQNSMVASSYNETALMGGAASTELEVRLSTKNKNVTPILSIKDRPHLNVYSARINNQPEETISATTGTGSVSSIVVTNSGSGYTVAPVVTISAPDVEGGIQATATAVLTGSAVTGISIVNAGSGYTSTPSIVVSRGVGDNSGVGAAAQALLTEFNTELLPTGGKAKARYITQKTKLDIISNGIRIFSTISSTQGSSVDWYVRTSLSSNGVEHESIGWNRIPCNVARNKSSYIGEFFEYEFRLDNLDSYDTYDLKCVLTATDPTKSPIVNSYRVIALA